jgi:hypothetical protein
MSLGTGMLSSFIAAVPVLAEDCPPRNLSVPEGSAESEQRSRPQQQPQRARPVIAEVHGAAADKCLSLFGAAILAVESASN